MAMQDTRQSLAAAVAEDTGDGSCLWAALGELVRAEGPSAVARRAGIDRVTLYRALHPGGNPTLATFLKVTAALGLQVRLEPQGHGDTTR